MRVLKLKMSSMLAGLFVGLSASSAYGQAAATEPLQTVLGSGIVLNLPSPLKRVALADEDIAKVNVLSPEEILIHGTKIGQTTVFAWLENDHRLDYLLRVTHDVTLLREILSSIDDRIKITPTPDGSSFVLRGTVDTAGASKEAERQANAIVAAMPPPQPMILNLLTAAPEAEALSEDEQLSLALLDIDPRIRMRRIAVSDRDAGNSNGGADSLVLEGEVETIQQLMQAITLAERQLGGMGNSIKASDDTRITENRLRVFMSDIGGGGSTSDVGGSSSSGNENEMPPQGLAAQLARGLIVTSESGRVVSFLEVDELQQILVSIRVLEIDRGRAKRAGIDYQVNAKNFSVGGYNLPTSSRIAADALGGKPSLTGKNGLGNIVGAYVGDSMSILGAVDLMEERSVARSVAEPNVLTLTGEEAAVKVGGEIPIPTTAVGDVAAVQGFQFQTFGVSLNIRPTLKGDDIITLEVAPSITVPNPGLGNGNVPGFEVQSVQTVARVKTGESLVLGGLLTYNDELVERKVPVLGHIPLLGLLFSWDEKVRTERELLFVMTPKIVENAEEGVEEPVVLPDAEFRDENFRQELEMTELDDENVPESWRDEEVEEAAEAEVEAERAEARQADDRKILICFEKDEEDASVEEAPESIDEAVETVEEQAVIEEPVEVEASAVKEENVEAEAVPVKKKSGFMTAKRLSKQSKAETKADEEAESFSWSDSSEKAGQEEATDAAEATAGDAGAAEASPTDGASLQTQTSWIVYLLRDMELRMVNHAIDMQQYVGIVLNREWYRLTGAELLASVE